MEPALQSSTAPYYRSRIAIDGVGLRDVPANFDVAPRTPVTADIKVGIITCSAACRRPPRRECANRNVCGESGVRVQHETHG